MTNKKTKLAATFTMIIMILSTVLIYTLVFGLLIGWKGQEQQGWEGLGVAVMFVMGIIFGTVAAVLGLAFSIPATILYSKSAKSGDISTASYVLSTLAALVYVVFFVLAMLVLFDVGAGYAMVLGCVSIFAAALNLGTCIFAWVSRKELVGSEKESATCEAEN